VATNLNSNKEDLLGQNSNPSENEIIFQTPISDVSSQLQVLILSLQS
jgi:hypothetical protein